jgi:hypothetical protein
MSGCAAALTLPPPQASFIWYCAWLSVPSAIYAATRPSTANFASGFVPASVWATSLLYWRHPLRNSWRRTLDIVTVISGVSYQSYYAFQTIRHTSPPHFACYTALITASAACYGISTYLMNRGRVWPSTYAHASIHLLANMANVALYQAPVEVKVDVSMI